MSESIKTILNQLNGEYPEYLFEINEYPRMLIVRIRRISSGFEYKGAIYNNGMPKYRVMYAIERMINEMKTEEEENIKNVVGWSSKNLIVNKHKRMLEEELNNSYYGLWPNKYSITPKELIFQDEKTTIINWTDGTKTVIKCSDGDTFSPEAGVALCYMKKFITDNDSERFHRLLKSLIIDISKVRYSNEEKQSNNDSESLPKLLLKGLMSVYKLDNSKEEKDGSES